MIGEGRRRERRKEEIKKRKERGRLYPRWASGREREKQGGLIWRFVRGKEWGW